MSVLERKTYKQIEWYLYNYHDVRHKVQEAKDDIINSGGRDYSEYGGGQPYRSDPTAAKALKLCKTDITQYERWLKVIEHVIKKYEGTTLGMLIQKRYFDDLGEIHTCQELHIERTTYYRWREEVILYTAMIAIQEGLIKINGVA